MKWIAVTQFIEDMEESGERTEGLDRRWLQLLHSCGFCPMPIPNLADVAIELFKITGVGGLVLTPGEDLAIYGGKTPERDKTEMALLNNAIKRQLPVLGVGRGMQLIQDFFGVKMEHLESPIYGEQVIEINGKRERINSFQDWGTRTTSSHLDVWAKSKDGIVKAVRHRDLPIVGIMWHPEKFLPYREADRELLTKLFGVR